MQQRYNPMRNKHKKYSLMNSEITKQEQKKIFSTYLGCDIQINKHPEFKGPIKDVLTGIVDTASFGILLNMKDSIYKYSMDDCQLLLTPLAEITDEHAIEVAKIARYGGNITPNIGRQLVTEYMYKVSNVRAAEWISVIDFLRENGYDCGYGPITSLIDVGIALHKDHATQPIRDLKVTHD